MYVCIYIYIYIYIRIYTYIYIYIYIGWIPPHYPALHPLRSPSSSSPPSTSFSLASLPPSRVRQGSRLEDGRPVRLSADHAGPRGQDNVALTL